MGQLTCLTKEIIMTNLEVFNNLSKQLFNGSTKFFDGILTVEGKVEDKNIDYVQKGLAFRKFFKQFELAKDVVIDEAEMKDGLLKIKLGFKEPKEIEGVKVDVK
jgi:HSP20 family molecular chaperone IbpA